MEKIDEGVRRGAGAEENSGKGFEPGTLARSKLKQTSKDKGQARGGGKR